ncbi:MAG: hypothetical protein ACE5JJ_06720 [Nitrospinota bacterium]
MKDFLVVPDRTEVKVRHTRTTPPGALKVLAAVALSLGRNLAMELCCSG